MQTSNENNMDSKHDMMSVIVSPFSEIGSDFVRGDKEHPFHYKTLISPIQDKLQLGVIKLPSKSPPQAIPKKSKHIALQTSTTFVIEGEVPCVVCHKNNLHVLVENGIFGNTTT